MAANSTTSPTNEVSDLATAGAEALVSAMPQADWEQIEGSIVGLLAGDDDGARETTRALLEQDRERLLDGRGRGVTDRWCLFLLGHLEEHPEAASELGRIIRATGR